MRLDGVKVGDLLTLRTTRRGDVTCVVASTRWMRTGSREYLLGPLDPSRHPKNVYYRITSKHERLVEPYRPAKGEPRVDDHDLAIKAAIDRVFEVRELRAEFDYKQADARREALGEVKWADSSAEARAQGAWAITDRFKPGDRVTVKGPGYTWEAVVSKVNVATGKVGVKVEVDPRQVADAARTRQAVEEFAHLLGGSRGRGPRGPRDVRWLDPRHILKVNGESLPERGEEHGK